MCKSTRHTTLGNLIVATLFVGLSATVWFVVNGYEVARDEGFDPLRYEYYARSDLPEYLADSSSYSIVLLLQFIYQYLPYYTGFVVFIGLCLFMVLNADNRKELRYATLSPLAFFYIAQTGKDGLAILALACVAITATRRVSIWHVLLAIVISIALFVRPALILFLPLTFVSIRYGTGIASVFAVIVSAFFLATGIGKESLSLLVGLVSNEGSGALVQFGRELTFGYSPIPIAGRSLFLIASPFIQPLASVLKFLSGTEQFVLFEGVCQLLFLFVLIQHRILWVFIFNSIPFIIVVAAASPFYHFRYMAILYPVICAISILEKQNSIRKKILRKKVSRLSTRSNYAPVSADA